jgi:hypothetical protein
VRRIGSFQSFTTASQPVHWYSSPSPLSWSTHDSGYSPSSKHSQHTRVHRHTLIFWLSNNAMLHVLHQLMSVRFQFLMIEAWRVRNPSSSLTLSRRLQNSVKASTNQGTCLNSSSEICISSLHFSKTHSQNLLDLLFFQTHHRKLGEQLFFKLDSQTLSSLHFSKLIPKNQNETEGYNAD